MSEQAPPPAGGGGGGGPEGGGGGGRRRRRRGRGGGGGPRAEGDGGEPRREPRPPQQGQPPQQQGQPRPQQPRREGQRPPQQQQQRREGQRPAQQQRREGRPPQPQQPRREGRPTRPPPALDEQALAAARKVARETPSAAITDVDAGWDDVAGATTAVAQISPELMAVARGQDVPARAATPPPAAETRWGDDEDAPTPDIRLSPDLPREPADPDGEDVFTQDALDDLDAPPRGPFLNLVPVKLSATGKAYECDAGDMSFARGDKVMIDSERGLLLGTVVAPSRRGHAQGGEVRRVARRAEPRDLERPVEAQAKAKEILAVAREAARRRRLDAKVFRAEVAPGGGKVTIYVSSDERLDFRDLLREISQRVPGRIDVRQTGVRDEAKAVGGIGSCGRELCCSTFLPRFDPVSIKMAKDQGLVLNPSKVSGQCGRLKCCLVYEQAAYAEMRKGLPKMGKRVETPAGEGRVAEIDVLRRRIRVSFGPGDFQTFPADVVTPIVVPPQESQKKRHLPMVQGVPVGAPAPDPDDDHDHDEPEAAPSETPEQA